MQTDEFYQIMQSLKLNNVPNWTVSTLQKAPIDPKSALANHFNPNTFQDWFKYASDPENTLVTLDELYAEPNTPKNQLALRVNVDKQHIILIDIERDYDEKLKPYLKHLPAVYGEHSNHGGLHYIVKIPDSILNDVKYQTLFMKSQVKIGTEDVEHSGVEMFFHNHYLTFTRNITRFKNNNTDDDLKYVLDFVIEQANQTLVDKTNNFDDATDIPTDALVIAQHAITKKKHNQIKKYISKNDIADNSEREAKNVFIIANSIVQSVNSNFGLQPFKPGELIDENSPHDPKMLTWALLHLVYQYMKPRSKWDRPTSDGQNYIQYTCNKEMNYCLSQK